MTQKERPGPGSRYWEIDALRGLAIIWMMAFHLTWDLVFYDLVRVHMGRGPWPWFSRIISTTFLTLVGISLVISEGRRPEPRRFHRYLVRGLKVFGLGLVITGITYLFLGRSFVVFGILHLIGVSVILAYPFLAYRRRWISLLIGVVLVLIGSQLNRQYASTPWFIWLGLPQFGRGMADWYPVLPWFGLVLVGITLGHTLYTGGQRQFALPDGSGLPVIRELAFLGRHALLIYLVHQPLLVGIAFAVSSITSGGG